jgi:hypothetical protein
MNMPVRHLTFWKPKVQVVFITRNTQKMLVIGHFLRIRANMPVRFYLVLELLSLSAFSFVSLSMCIYNLVD